MEKYILSLDQGTTSSRAILFDHQGQIQAVAQKEFQQIFPQSGCVEHDPNEIWTSQASVIAEVISKLGINGLSIAAIGITNQRETTVVWNRKTGQEIYNAIVWQDRRTAGYCDQLKNTNWSDAIRQKTGLIIDAYFSGTKIRWILQNVPGAKELAEKGELAFGTIDSWLIWKLTQGRTHATDVSNASRTMLFNINTMDWDDELLELMEIPRSMMPVVHESSGIIDYTNTTLFASKIPISGVAGDQQAALFGQLCTKPGMVKNTYGTGCFMLKNIGDKPILSKNNLLTTVAWKIDGKTQYALEGSIFVAGSVVQWLRDGLGIINTSKDVEELAASVPDHGDVYFVPALTGLGAPYWDQYARGSIVGISRGTTAAHIARAALEGIAFQTMEVLRAMEEDDGVKIIELRVDGGASANKLLMQFQTDLLGIPVVRPKILETTALGAAYLAGLGVKFWMNLEELQSQWVPDIRFEPEKPLSVMEATISKWKNAVQRSLNWINE